MDTMSAFIRGEANRGREMMVFDWGKAARLIKERNAVHAEAGLQGDWEYTGGVIFDEGKPIPREDTYVYLSSTWATPEIKIDGSTEPCFKMESETPGWDAHTYWPDEARAILDDGTHKMEEKP